MDDSRDDIPRRRSRSSTFYLSVKFRNSRHYAPPRARIEWREREREYEDRKQGREVIEIF